MGTLTPVVYSIISMVAAMGLPRSSLTNSSASRHWIANFCTARGLWATSQLCFTTAMMGTFFVSSALGTVILFGFVGITFGINTIVPFYLLGEELSRPSSTHWTEIVWSQSQGLIYGLNNLAICLPQILIICLMGIIWRQSGGQGHGEGVPARDVVWFLRFGGLATLVATYFVSRLEKRGQDEETAEYVEIPLEAEA